MKTSQIVIALANKGRQNGYGQQITAIHPNTKRQIVLSTPKLTKEGNQYLDDTNEEGKHYQVGSMIVTTHAFKMIASGKGTYYAVQLEKSKNEKCEGGIALYRANFVQIYDALAGKPIITITPPDHKGKPLESRVVDLDFSFVRKDGTLKYTLNGEEGKILDKYNGTQSGEDVQIDENKVYFKGRKIAQIGEKIKYATAVDADEFERTFRIKNKERYDKNRDFFRNSN